MDEVFENLNRSFKNLPKTNPDDQNAQQDAANANNDRSATPTIDLAQKTLLGSSKQDQANNKYQSLPNVAET